MRDLWGITVALLISLLFMASLMKLENGAHQDTIQLAVAQQAQTLEKAAAGYITQYKTQLLTATTATTPATITVPMLVATKLLPPSTEATDIYGQSWEVEVLQPSSGELQAFLITTGRSLDNIAGVDIAQEIGSNGGFYPQPSSVYPAGTIMGTGGAWEQPAANWHVGQGELAVYVDTSGDTNSDYLYRNAVPGDLEANTMNTPLIMSAIETSGAACASSGAIAQDGTGWLLSCQSGKWESVGGGQWKAPVATYSALPGSGNKTGDVRLTMDTDRAFAWNGGSWVALAVDQNGNLDVPATLTAANSQIANDETVGGNESVSGNETVRGSDTVSGGATVGGTLYANSPGWAEITSSTGGQTSPAGSEDVNDIYVRSTGLWLSHTQELTQQLQNEYANQQGQINNLSNEYSGQQTQITSINSNLNQSNCDSTSYSSITNLCNDYTSLENSAGGLGNNLGSGTAIPRQVTSTTWGCLYSWRGRCYQWGWVTNTSWQAPTITVSASTGYAVVVSIQGSAGYLDGGPGQNRSPYYCSIGAWSTPPAVYLTYHDSSGAQQQSALDESVGAYADGVMFPVGGTFTVPAGRVATITLSGGSDHLGCGSFSYQLTKD
jgi:hypothetical protein